jgi:hypothetical protein
MTLKQLRADVAGFTGRFFHDEERGDIAYIAKRCEDKECDCEPSYNADGDIDCSVSLLDDTGNVDDIGHPIARMLNALAVLLPVVEAADALTDIRMRPCAHEHELEYGRARFALDDAISTMRATLSGEKRGG